MPRLQFYTGNVGGSVLPNSPVPQQPDYGVLMRGGGGRGIDGMIVDAILGRNPNSPQAQLARQRAAQTKLLEQKVQDAQDAAAAEGQFTDDVGAYADRVGPSPIRGVFQDDGATPLPVQTTGAPDMTPAQIVGNPAAAPAPTQADLNSRALSAAGAAAMRAIGRGADVKKVTPILDAFNLTLGDDAGIVRTNAAMNHVYLGKDTAPSLQRQDQLRHEDFAQANAQEQERLRMQKYGFDTQAETSRRDTDVRAGVARADTGAHVAEEARAHNMEDKRGRDLDRAKNYIDMLKFYTPEVKRTYKTGEGPAGPSRSTTTDVGGKALPRPAAKKADPMGLR